MHVCMWLHACACVCVYVIACVHAPVQTAACLSLQHEIYVSFSQLINFVNAPVPV